VYQDQIYIYGGRNDLDISDLHVFNSTEKKWTELALKQRVPKPRRRASAVFIASSLVLFGGFDGEFYNDLHALHLNDSC
jgi:N-acetylneuraminic acid mutarotase